MNIIQYCQKYEGKVVTLWNKTLYGDTLSVEKFRNMVLFDENFNEEYALVALMEEEVVGFILGIKRIFPYLERGLEPTRGWISVLFVDEKYQNQGIGKKLLETIESKFRDVGVHNVTLGAYSPNYFFPGIDNQAYEASKVFFEKRGYVNQGEAVSMYKTLYGFVFDESMQVKKIEAEKKGYQFKNFTYNYALKLLAFLKAEFGGGWKRNALMSMQAGLAENNILIVVDKDDEVVGFCMRQMDGNPCRFGPFGVKESLRSHGLGGVLFDLMQKDMLSKGIYHLYFLWTSGPGQRFYERHGVHVYRSYTLYKKEIV